MSPESALAEFRRRRRSRHLIFWQIVNPPTRRVAGFAPWWVLLETHGRRTGKPRTTPLARGPVDGDVVWLTSVHGRRAHWVRNLEATPEVRIKLSGRWHHAHATVHDYNEATVRRFNRYARSGPRTLGIDPVLVRVELAGRRSGALGRPRGRVVVAIHSRIRQLTEMVSGLATRIDRGKRALSHTARTWGSTADDWELTFACDSHLSRHDVAVHRAIEVAASAPTVFRWLCQLRVAPYSYDWLDNLGRRSPRRLTPGLDELKLGQRFMWIFKLVEFEPDEHVTLAYRLAPAFGNYAVTYRVVSVETDRCRLVVKLLIAAPRRGPFRPAVRATAPYADLFMMQKQLRTLKQLAEEVGVGRP